MMKRQPNSRMCFICGLQNPIGLRMALYNDLDENCVRSTVVVPDQFQGYPGVVHGGIVATLLDEVAGRATLTSGNHDDLMVTVKIQVKYRQPTPTETPLTVVGRITQPGRTRARAYGEVRLPDGVVTAEADLLLARPPGDFKQRWRAEMPYWRVYDD